MISKKGQNKKNATIVLGSGLQSRRVREELLKLARVSNLSLEQVTARVLKYGIYNRLSIVQQNIRAESVLIKERPKLREATNVRIVVDAQTKSELVTISTKNCLTRLQAYNNVLDATLAASKRDRSVVDRIIKVDPIEPWPNEIKRELK